MSFHNDAIFWVDTDRIKPNPYQPRRDFDAGKLNNLADSIRQYGVLQPLVVTRKESYDDDGNMAVGYELIAGERRLRASKIAGLQQVPVVIRSDEEQDNVKLELAIIENLQREDLNAIDRARAFARLVEEFGHKHGQIGQKVGRSREYVSNSIRLLQLPEEMSSALAGGRITEGHARPLLMLSERPEEQRTLFKEIILKKITVRDAEHISRKIAPDKVRKGRLLPKPEIVQLEEEASESLGARVQIREREHGGRVTIEFNSQDDLRNIIDVLKAKRAAELASRVDNINETPLEQDIEEVVQKEKESDTEDPNPVSRDGQGEDDIYSISNFSV